MTSPSTFKRNTVLVASVLVLGVIGWQLQGHDSSGEKIAVVPSNPRRLPVQITPVALQAAYDVEDRFLGEVEARRSSQLGFELAGTVQNLEVDEGDSVTVGQLLAELDTARLLASRSQQEALLDEAKATLKLTASTLRRVATLAATSAVSVQDLDEATQRRDAAQASVDGVNAAIQSIEVDLSKARLVAPYDGRIAARKVDEGAIVGPGQVVLVLIESGALEARIGMKADLVTSIYAGEKVSLVLAQTSETIAAQVRQVSPQQDRRTRTVDVLLSISESEKLVPGDLVEWPMITSIEAEGAWLPRTALTSSTRGLWAVFIATAAKERGDYELERREVEVIHLEGDRVFVRGALRDGQLAVTDGLQRLVPGQKVTLSSN